MRGHSCLNYSAPQSQMAQKRKTEQCSSIGSETLEGVRAFQGSRDEGAPGQDAAIPSSGERQSRGAQAPTRAAESSLQMTDVCRFVFMPPSGTRVLQIKLDG